ncbi:MAG TPA: hypothetical protein VFZ61_21935 [Polyangiales bacterium]
MPPWLRAQLKRWSPGAPWPLLVAAGLLVVGVLIAQLFTLRAPLMGEHNWRQSDTYSVAYNFAFERASFLYPRVDFNRGRSGIMGMETPVYTYTTGQLMRVLGDGPLAGRLVNWLSLMLGLGAACLAFRPVAEAQVARAGVQPNPLWLPIGLITFAVLSPLFFFEGRQIQPDPSMAALTTAAAACFHAFSKRPTPWIYALGMASYGLAVGTKSPAIIAGPALWLLSFTASRGVRWYTPLLRGLPFVLPLALFWGWDKWAHHLDDKFNEGFKYFEIDFKLREYIDRFKDMDAMRRAFGFVFTSYTSSWVLLPALLAGLALAFRRGYRAISLPMLVWLVIGLFLCAGSERLTWHWYYAFMLMLPLFYFGGVGLASVFEGVACYEQTSLALRWSVWQLVLAFALTRFIGGPARALKDAIGAGYPPGPTWTTPSNLLWLLGVQLVALLLALTLRFRGARLVASVALAVSCAVAIPRALHDLRQTFLWRARVDLWPDMEKHWLPMRRELDQVSTRADLFVVDGYNPWYLYLARRKGFVHGDPPNHEEWVRIIKSKTRFYLHFHERGGGIHTNLSGHPLLRKGERWELYCLDPEGCEPLRK